MLWQSPVSSALLYVWRTSPYSITYVTTRTILVSAGFQLRRIGREAKCLQLLVRQTPHQWQLRAPCRQQCQVRRLTAIAAQPTLSCTTRASLQDRFRP